MNRPFYCLYEVFASLLFLLKLERQWLSLCSCRNLNSHLVAVGSVFYCLAGVEQYEFVLRLVDGPCDCLRSCLAVLYGVHSINGLLVFGCSKPRFAVVVVRRCHRIIYSFTVAVHPRAYVEQYLLHLGLYSSVRSRTNAERQTSAFSHNLRKDGNHLGW